MWNWPQRKLQGSVDISLICAQLLRLGLETHINRPNTTGLLACLVRATCSFKGDSDFSDPTGYIYIQYSFQSTLQWRGHLTNQHWAAPELHSTPLLTHMKDQHCKTSMLFWPSIDKSVWICLWHTWIILPSLKRKKNTQRYLCQVSRGVYTNHTNYYYLDSMTYISTGWV